MSDAAPSIERLPALTAGDALFLDFDGTLAPLQDDADTVAMPPDLPDAILIVAARLGGALALVSGRDIRDLAKRTPAGVWRVGGHGLEVCAPHEAPAPAAPAAPDALRADADAVVDGAPGAFVEAKGPILALHYRQAPDAGAAIEAGARAAAARCAGYKVQHGKFVVELKPTRADKGRAVAARMEAAPFAGRRPIMAGDDVTDEDAFAEIARRDGVAIKVGAGPTIAPLRADEVAAIHAWLRREAAR